MKRLGLILLAGTAFTNSLSYADTVSNGGDVKVCNLATEPNGHATVELFDFFESRTLGRGHVDLGPADLSVIEKVRLAISRLPEFDHDRTQLYNSWLDAFFSVDHPDGRSQLVADVTLRDIPDTDSDLLPTGCTIQQAAVQRTPDLDGDPRYLIDIDLWSVMDNDNKAGLVLHELLYREAIAKGATDSRRVRRLNSLLATKALDFVDHVAYAKFMSKLGFSASTYTRQFVSPDGLVNDMVFDLESVTFGPSQEMAGNVAAEHDLTVQLCDRNAAPDGGLVRLGYSTSADQAVAFYGNGCPRSVFIDHLISRHFATAANPSFEASGTITFYAEGPVKSAVIYQGVRLLKASGQIVEVDEGHQVEFDLSGYLTSL